MSDDYTFEITCGLCFCEGAEVEEIHLSGKASARGWVWCPTCQKQYAQEFKLEVDESKAPVLSNDDE